MNCSESGEKEEWTSSYEQMLACVSILAAAVSFCDLEKKQPLSLRPLETTTHCSKDELFAGGLRVVIASDYCNKTLLLPYMYEILGRVKMDRKLSSAKS